MEGSALSTFSRGSRLSPKRTASQTMAATTLATANEASNGAYDRNRESLPNGAMGRREREGAPDSPRDSPATNRIRTFMGKTPSAIKSKFLSVLGNSTEIINGISNKVSLVYRSIVCLFVFSPFLRCCCSRRVTNVS
uniref:Uncharacterized protein n=1 Tax=Anopheles culicifacies TaxID=139723 RepID=A0A182MSK3_9DIPT